MRQNSNLKISCLSTNGIYEYIILLVFVYSWVEYVRSLIKRDLVYFCQGKLYYRHGTVGSAKTMNLLAVAYKYDSQQRKV